jgi:mono/diheme cytochrome c family protein
MAGLPQSGAVWFQRHAACRRSATADEKESPVKRFLYGVLTTIAVAVIGLLFVAFSGVADVSAGGSHLPGMDWFLSTTSDSSVERHAEGIRVPPDLDQLSRQQAGLAHYHEMCVGCHGAPGVPPSEIGEGLDPRPPHLQDGVDDPARVFWVVKHGIRMTGMPAFGPSHDDQTLWDIVAFVERLPSMSADIYAQELRAAGIEPAEGAEGGDGDEGAQATPAAGDAHGSG